MPGKAIWDGWENITQTLNKFAWILSLVGGILSIVMGIWSFAWYSIYSPLTAITSLISGIIYGSLAIVGAILFMPISKQLKTNDYENVNLIMLIISAVLAMIGVWLYFWAIPHMLIAVFFCILSEYGWPAGSGSSE